MKYGAPNAEKFAVIIFVKTNKNYLVISPFKLRIDNRALAWHKTYPIDQSYVCSWIIRLDGFHMIIEHRIYDQHQRADRLSKKKEFYERLKEKQLNKQNLRMVFLFWTKTPMTKCHSPGGLTNQGISN